MLTYFLLYLLRVWGALLTGAASGHYKRIHLLLLPPSQLTEQRNPQRATPLQQGSVLVYSCRDFRKEFPAVALLALAAAALDRGL